MKNNLFTNLDRLTDILMEKDDNNEAEFPYYVTLFSSNKSEAGYATYNGFKVKFDNVFSDCDEQYYYLEFSYIPEGRTYSEGDNLEPSFAVRVYKYRNEVERLEGCLFSYNVILKIVEFYVPSMVQAILLDENVMKARVEKELGQMRVIL